MKQLPVVLLLTLILFGGFTIYRYTEIMSPVWTVTAAQQAAIDLDVAKANSHVDIQAHEERAQLFTGALQGVVSAAFMLIVIFGAVHAWRIYDQRRESWARAVDGTFALQSFSNGQVRWQIDPNKQATGTTGFQLATGALGEFVSQTGADRQLAYNLSVQKTRTAQAATGADGVRNSAQAKLAAGYYDRNDMPALPMLDDGDPLQLTVAPWQPLTAQDAFAQSSPNRWILGQSPTTGELFELNPKEAAHFGIVGATGSGKTGYSALLLMAYAIKHKYRVVILDGKGGSDWSKYQHIAEYYALDYANVGGIVGQMVSEYTKRQAILNQYGVNSIWELPSGVTKPRPSLFIVDEFGATMDSLKAANKTAYKAVELDLGNLLRLSRGAGLYVVLCDQNPSKWPGTVRANLPVNLCYRLGGGIGNAVQEYNLDRLERVGQFQVSNEVYNAFKTFEVIDQLLPDGGYRKPLALLTIDSTITERGEGTGPNPTPQHDSDDSTIATITPVSNSAIDSEDDSGNSNDSTINSAPLTGKPLSRKEIELVKNTFALTNRSRKKTVEILYGKWTVSRDSWVKDIVSGEVLQ